MKDVLKSLAALVAACVTAIAPGSARAATKYWVQPMSRPGATTSGFSALSETGYVSGADSLGDFVFIRGTFYALNCSVSWGSIGDKGETLCFDSATLSNKLWMPPPAVSYDLTALGIAPTMVNGSGQVVGHRNGNLALFKAGVVTEYPVPTDGSNELFVASNGFVAGFRPDRTPFFFDGSRDLSVPLYRLSNNSDRRRAAVNAKGMVAGNFVDPADPPGVIHLGIWTSADLQNPQNLGTDSPGRPGVSIGEDQRAFNARGDFAGNDNGDGFGPYGWLQSSYLYEKTQNRFTFIAGFGGEYTCLHDVNDNGLAVGHSTTPGLPPELGGDGGPGGEYVFKNGKMYDLNRLVPVGTPFLGGYSGLINNNGQILADGGDGRAWLLTPLPVTTASALTGAGRAPAFNTSSSATLTATDAVTGVKEIRYRLDGAAVKVSPGASASVNGLSGGSHRITHWAVDKAGHAADAEDAFYNVDRGGLLVTTASPVVATVDSAFSLALAATGGTAPYTFAVTGSLPPGLTRAGAVVSGTPTTPGTFSFNVTVTDKAKKTATSYVSFKVQPAFTVTSPAILPVSAAAPVMLTATGGQEPLTWQVTGLPAGVMLHGPTLLVDASVPAGEYPVTFTVTDDAGRTATQLITLSVN